MENDSLIMVCIDDFAIKKNQSYGTVMIDIDSRKIIDMIPSRDYEDVKSWLSTYPHIELVSRDGSATYRKAIADAFPNAVQVSDRFHLLKGLTEYAKDYLKKALTVRIKIPATNGIMSEGCSDTDNSKEHRLIGLKEKYEQIGLLSTSGLNKSAVCKNLNMDVRTYDKLISATPEEIEVRFTTKRERNHEEKVKNKLEIVNEVRSLKAQGLSGRKIATHLGLAKGTVSRYLDEKFNPSYATYGERKAGKLTPFINEINSMLMQGIMGTIIEKSIRDKGYSGSSHNLRHYIADWKRKRKQDANSGIKNISAVEAITGNVGDIEFTGKDMSAAKDKSKYSGAVEIIERKNLIKLLYKPPEKVKCISSCQLDAVFEKYPCFLKVYTKVWDFKYLLQENEPDMLDQWLESVKTLGISELDSFSKGINSDYVAVKNAIVLPYSNGLAEGKVNKLKVIKRIMFGRCSFILLKIKTLLLEKYRNFN
jgi:predicted transcriptional regulator